MKESEKVRKVLTSGENKNKNKIQIIETTINKTLFLPTKLYLSQLFNLTKLERP